MNIGLFGGTFDPPHIGHLIVAQDARVRLGLDRLVFIPAASPPHKRKVPVTPAPIRLAMVEAAIHGDLRFEVDDLELEREGPSYTVDTLRIYRGRHPDDELYLLLGADQYAEIGSWREADVLPSLARLVVFERPGARMPRKARGEPVADVIGVDVTRIDVSSTDIRGRVERGEPIRYLVPLSVEALIRRHSLYEPVADREPARGVRK